MAIPNEEGEMESAIVDMESINKMESSFIDLKAEIFENAEYTIVDADNPQLLEYVLKKFQGKTKFILDPVSANKATKISHLMKYFHTIKPNRLETEALCGFKINGYEDLQKAGRYFLVTRSGKCIYKFRCRWNLLSYKDEEGTICQNDKIDVKNVTGAGDSFVAGLGLDI